MSGERRRVRAWYGLPGTIAIEHAHWHLVTVGPVPLPHPPLVNLLLRRTLPPEERLRLSFWHELGHLQALPFALAHAAWLLRNGPRRPALRWRRLAVGLLAHEAAWELAAESYVLAKVGRGYRRAYREHPNPLLAPFWVGMAVLALLGTALARRGAAAERP